MVDLISYFIHRFMLRSIYVSDMQKCGINVTVLLKVVHKVVLVLLQVYKGYKVTQVMRLLLYLHYTNLWVYWFMFMKTFENDCHCSLHECICLFVCFPPPPIFSFFPNCKLVLEHLDLLSLAYVFKLLGQTVCFRYLHTKKKMNSKEP